MHGWWSSCREVALRHASIAARLTMGGCSYNGCATLLPVISEVVNYKFINCYKFL